MEYRHLGKAGLKVSVLGLGGNNFGMNLGVAGMPVRADEEQTSRVIVQALDVGINFFDTANEYGDSELFIGRALKGKRHQVVIATKFGIRVDDSANSQGASRKHLMEQVEISLRRLQTDYIDLYQVHRPDPQTPIEETLRALDDLVRQGKVRYIGCSNFQAWQLCEAIWTSGVLNLNSFVSVQPEYNLLRRGVERELLPCCRAYNVGVIPYWPLASGVLTGKYRAGKPPPPGSRLAAVTPQVASRALSERRLGTVSSLERFAADRGHMVGELAVAWLAANPLVSTIIAGATKPEQVAANARGADWKLTKAELEEVDKISPP